MCVSLSDFCSFFLFSCRFSFPLPLDIHLFSLLYCVRLFGIFNRYLYATDLIGSQCMQNSKQHQHQRQHHRHFSISSVLFSLVHLSIIHTYIYIYVSLFAFDMQVKRAHLWIEQRDSYQLCIHVQRNFLPTPSTYQTKICSQIRLIDIPHKWIRFRKSWTLAHSALAKRTRWHTRQQHLRVKDTDRVQHTQKRLARTQPPSRWPKRANRSVINYEQFYNFTVLQNHDVARCLSQSDTRTRTHK